MYDVLCLLLALKVAACFDSLQLQFMSGQVRSTKGNEALREGSLTNFGLTITVNLKVSLDYVI